MQQVQNLFLQLNELAEVQGEQVDAITENVEAANTDVHRGVQELEEAVTKSKKASKRNLYILLATIIVLLVVAIPLIIKVHELAAFAFSSHRSRCPVLWLTLLPPLLPSMLSSRRLER